MKLKHPQLLLWLILTLLWIGANHARIWITPRCISQPTPCTKESIFWVDRLSFGMEDWRADQYSYWTQNLSGVLGFALPLLSLIILYFGGFRSPMLFQTSKSSRKKAFFYQGLTEIQILLYTSILNGLCFEIAHFISQRPRPFVYLDPLHRGTDPAHYTSFYSGHSSFTAAILVAAFVLLIRRGLPRWILILISMIDVSLIFSTAYFRILAGRHFLTDVICGILAGGFVGWTMANSPRLLATSLAESSIRSKSRAINQI